jgi:hypothetical protein
VEVWRAAWIAVYMVDLEKGGTGRGSIGLGRLDNTLHASRTTGEAVKRLSNVRRMPEYSVEA